MTPLANKTAAENKALVENIMAARSRRDPSPFIAAMADDFVWQFNVPLSPIIYGRDAARAELLINITKLAPHQARMSYGMPRTRCFLTPWTRLTELPSGKKFPPECPQLC